MTWTPRVVRGGADGDRATGAVASEPGAGQLPPHDISTERVVLSAVMLDPEALPRVRAILRPEQFYLEAHRRIYEAALYVADRGEPVDAATVMARLHATHRLDQVGGAEEIMAIMHSTPAVAHVEAHAHVVLDRWREREAIAIMREAIARAYVGHVDETQAYIDHVVHRLDVLARSGPMRAQERNEHALQRILGDIRSRAADGGRRRGLPTGYPSIDRLTGGLHAGRKVSIGALTGRGKTTMGVNLALHQGAHGVGVAVYLAEITRDEWLEKAIAVLARVDAQRMVQGMLGYDEMQRLAGASDQLARMPIEIVADPEMHIDRIRATTHQMVGRFPRMHGAPLGVVIVDHVHRLSAPPHMRYRDRMALVCDATRGLKLLAQRAGVCVVELAQLRGQSRDEMRMRPELGAIMYPEIEREADDVWYLHRPVVRGIRPPAGGPVQLDVIVAKSRFGQTGCAELAWYRDQGRIAEEDIPPPLEQVPMGRVSDMIGDDDGGGA